MRALRAVVFASIGLAGLLSRGGAAESAPAASRIVIGPNVLVSRDGDVAHCETMVVANPKDPKNLIGTSITLTRPDGGATNKAYVSADGGSTWQDVGFDEGEQGGGDPQVGFGASGTAYFTGISFTNGIYFCRSEDGGKTWSKPMTVGRGDHEMLVTDYTTGPYAGRVYIAEETDQKGSNELEDLIMRRRVVLFRSSDDGRSFVGPIEVAVGDGRGLAAYNPLVLSDGTLFLPMSSYPNYAKEKDAATWKALFSLSKDGGVTFTPKRAIGEIYFGGVAKMRDQQKSGRIDQIGGPTFAADTSTNSKLRDRLYAAWTELQGDRFRLLLTHSNDRGATWSKPKPVDPGAPADASQFQQMVAVNPDGVLGVFFYSTEGFRERDKFDVYFTASLDGGQTFLPKARVSSQTSHPYGAGNLRPGPFVMKERGMTIVYTTSGISRWPDGGDYIGMAADSDGAFHPFWADGRSGTYQLYTASIRLKGDAAAKAPEVEKASLTDRVTLTFDPIQYDPAKLEVLLPVRLKNTSKQTLYPPFVVEIKEVAHPYTVKSGEPINAPAFLNSANGKDGVGATYDYSKALGGLDALEPGAVTDALVWRLKAQSAMKTDFYLGTEITGFVTKKETK